MEGHDGYEWIDEDEEEYYEEEEVVPTPPKKRMGRPPKNTKDK
jgi:hypothetical protein